MSRRFRVGTHTALVPDLAIGYETELADTSRQVIAETQGGAWNWQIDGLSPGRGSVDVHAGLALETDKTQSFFVSYDRAQRSNGSSQGFMAGWRHRL